MSIWYEGLTFRNSIHHRLTQPSYNIIPTDDGNVEAVGRWQWWWSTKAGWRYTAKKIDSLQAIRPSSISSMKEERGTNTTVKNANVCSKCTIRTLLCRAVPATTSTTGWSPGICCVSVCNSRALDQKSWAGLSRLARSADAIKPEMNIISNHLLLFYRTAVA